VQAAPYSSKPITLFVPYPPGGPSDVIARAVSNELGRQLKTSIIVENKPGAAGNIGMALAARPPADGYMLALPGSALSINTVIFDNVRYKTSNFRAVGLVAQRPVVAVVHPSTQIKSVADIFAKAKAAPGALSFPSGGRGTSPHLAGALLAKQARVQMTHEPYNGTGEFIPDLLAGRVQVVFLSPLIANQHIESGALVPVATTGTTRLRG
jgi:tripartite-type tricarboxylate transporter receptor subunit TctC